MVVGELTEKHMKGNLKTINNFFSGADKIWKQKNNEHNFIIKLGCPLNVLDTGYTNE